MFKKILAMSLVVTIIGTGTEIDTLANTIQKDSSTIELANKDQDTDISIIKELKSERTENTNTYLMSDGSKQLEMFFEDIRFYDNEKLVDYDATLIPNKEEIILGKDLKISPENYAYSNAVGDSKQYIPSTLSEESPVVLVKGENLISFFPVREQDTDISKVSIDKDGNAEYKLEDKIFEFISGNKGVKENVIFESKPEIYEISYEVNLNNSYLEYSKETNQILVKKESDDLVSAYITAPFLNDNSGININYDVITQVEKADDTWIVTYKLPKEYFENVETEYPVVLDPSFVWSTSSNVEIRETLNVGASRSSVIDCSNKFMVANLSGGNGCDGYGAQVNIRFKNFHNMIRGKYISFSYLNMVKESKGGTPKFSIYPIIEDWDYLTTNWNNKPSVSNESVCDMNITYEYPTIQPWLTNWVRKLASGEIDDDYGIALYPQEESEYFYLWLYGLNATNTSEGMVRRPSFIVNYMDPEDVGATYDGTFQIQGEYDEDNNEIELSWNAYSDDTGRYDLYVRKNDNNHFEYTGQTDENSIFYTVSGDDDTTVNSSIENYDFRVVAVNEGSIDQYGPYDTQILSNICSFEKSEYTYADEEENEQTETIYEPCVRDTDSDNLEDGYEIWDFKTLWNTETLDSTEDNPIYVLDSDNDGFPDDYEVFTLGTNPAAANVVGVDSDGDNWTDIREYQEGTDPYLEDSDFDGTNDRGDSTPRKTNNNTSQTRAAAANVHIGLYDKQYSEIIDGVTYTYVTNIYRGDIKKLDIDYGNANLNKTLKYFYDEEGNNTAIIEAYDETYDPNHTQTICITYTYDSDNNLTFICDQRTKYTMTYNSEGQMASLKVGNQYLMNYSDNQLVNNAGTDGDTSNISVGGIIDKNEHTETYGNGQVVRYITSTYKVAEDDTESTASTIELFYDDDIEPTYITYYNSEGELKKFEDYSSDDENPIEWSYTYSENGTSLSRSDDFTKSIQVSENEDTGVSTTVTSYGFKNLNNVSTTYTNTVTYETETETNSEGAEVTRYITNQTLHNNDTVHIESEEDSYEEVIHSGIFNIDLINTTYEKNGNTLATFSSDLYGNTNDKEYEYTYDLAGNITQIKEDNVVKYEYGYDAHGRITFEKNYVTYKEYGYDYNTSGNVYGKTEYSINASGVRTDSDGITIHYTYDNNNWPDQLTTYNGQTITYDNSGNPIDYLNGMEFSWNRGRQLSDIELEHGSIIHYNYNQDGLRTYKETADATITYEWDVNTLIREIVTYKATNQKYDIWYLYDANNNAIGFEYSYFPTSSIFATSRIYYEKNLQGDVVGLLDARGTKIASYAYDAWGNVTSSSCISSYQLPYTLNHIKYRGYYQDDETDFYYLQSRYYDAEVGRFINADSVQQLGKAKLVIAANNLYCYCENNPCLYIDPTGKGVFVLTLAVICIAIGVSGCARKETPKKYVPKYNISAEKITSDTMNYNCYAYALGKRKWSSVGQYSNNIIKKMDIGKLLSGVKADLKALGYKVKTVNSNYSPQKGETMFAMRSGTRDYHFIKKVGTKWKHKPGRTAILTLKGNPGDYEKWYCEYFDGTQWGIDTSITYDSKIYYVVYYK